MGMLMKGNIVRVKPLEMVNLFTLMVMFTKVNLKMIERMGMELLFNKKIVSQELVFG